MISWQKIGFSPNRTLDLVYYNRRHDRTGGGSIPPVRTTIKNAMTDVYAVTDELRIMLGQTESGLHKQFGGIQMEDDVSGFTFDGRRLCDHQTGEIRYLPNMTLTRCIELSLAMPEIVDALCELQEDLLETALDGKRSLQEAYDRLQELLEHSKKDLR